MANRFMSSVQFSHSVVSDSLRSHGLQDTGLPVHHQLREHAPTHAHWVGGAIQPSHPLSFPSPPAFSLSQHQGLFQWVSSSHQLAKVLELQLQQPLLQSCIWQVFQSPLFQEELDAGKMNDLTRIYKSSGHESWDMKSKVTQPSHKVPPDLRG